MFDACRLYYNVVAAAVTRVSPTDWSLPRILEPTSFGEEAKVAALCDEPHDVKLNAESKCGDCGGDTMCDEDEVEEDVEDNVDGTNDVEIKCSMCNIQYSLENYPEHVPVFVPRCLHVICTTCCKIKAVSNRKCPVDGCDMDCAGEVNAFPMHVVIVKRLRDLYTKRNSPSSAETDGDITTHSVAQPCTADCDMNQQQRKAASSCKEGEAGEPIKHDAKWFCSICDESFCEDYYLNVHQRFKMTKTHPVVLLEDIDPVDRHEASLTHCTNPEHSGTNVAFFNTATQKFHCRLCIAPRENEKDSLSVMKNDYAVIASMLQSSDSVYAKCSELHRSIQARLHYEKQTLKSECKQINAWYTAAISELTKERDSRMIELCNISTQTQTKLKAELAKLTPVVQSVETAAIDIGVRPCRHTGEALRRLAGHSDAPVVRKAKELLETLNNILTDLREPAQKCYTDACVNGPVTRSAMGGIVARSVVAPVSEESPRLLSNLSTAVDIALSTAHSSSSSSSMPPRMSPLVAFHILHRTAKDTKSAFNVPLVWFALGHCYHRGIGTSSSLQEAVNWYSKAAEAGMLWAMEMIAECHADDHWATSEKDKCRSVYADAVHRAVLYRSIAESKSCSEAPTAAALLVRTWALYPFTRGIDSLRAGSPSMREYKSTLPTLLRTHFLPRVMPVHDVLAHPKDSLALFTLLNVDFRSVVPPMEWWDILSQLGNTLSLASAHYLIAKELVVGSRYYTQSDEDNADVMTVRSSSATASATATSASSSISSTAATTSNGVPSQPRLTWLEKLWKSVEWVHDSVVNGDNNASLSDPLAALALAELSCDYLEGRFSLACLPSHLNAMKSKANEWFRGFDFDESRLSQVRMLLSRWLHPVIVDGYESARMLSARLVLTTEYLGARSDKGVDVSSSDFARVVVESTCPKGSSSAFALCRKLLWNTITNQKYVPNLSSLMECGVIPLHAIMSDARQYSSSKSTSTPSSSSLSVDSGSADQPSIADVLRFYADRTGNPQLIVPVTASSDHVSVLGGVADKGSVDARAVIADCHFLQLFIQKHQMLTQSRGAVASVDEQHGSSGECSSVDDDVALFTWSLVATEFGDASSALRIAAHYLQGGKSGNDSVKAVKWYERAANGGDITAMCKLGECYEYGTGVAKNELKAFEWYKKAAEGGDVKAMRSLGLCYLNGAGVAEDSVTAAEWYEKAWRTDSTVPPLVSNMIVDVEIDAKRYTTPGDDVLESHIFSMANMHWKLLFLRRNYIQNPRYSLSDKTFDTFLKLVTPVTKPFNAHFAFELLHPNDSSKNAFLSEHIARDMVHTSDYGFIGWSEWALGNMPSFTDADGKLTIRIFLREEARARHAEIQAGTKSSSKK